MERAIEIYTSMSRKGEWTVTKPSKPSNFLRTQLYLRHWFERYMTDDALPKQLGRAPSDTVDDLPTQPRAMAEEVWTDWVFALEALFVANAKDGLGGQINVDQNLRLGRILSDLVGQARS